MGVREVMVVVLTGVAACGEPEVIDTLPLGGDAPPAAEAPAEAAPPHGADAAAANPHAPGSSNELMQGKVFEVVTDSAATYLAIDICGVMRWVSSPTAEHSKGDVVVVLASGEAPDVTLGDRNLVGIVKGARVAASTGEVDCGPGAVNGISAAINAATGANAAPPTVPTNGAGKVLETMASGGYTYARLDVCGDEMWVAGPETALRVGEVLGLPDGRMPMTNFTSSTLGRTFDSIDFLMAIQVQTDPPDCG